MAEHTHSRGGPTPQDYYDGFTRDRSSLKDRFKNIDEQVHFDNSVQQLSDPHTKNFVLDFGNDDAFCAMNLETEDLKLLLKKPRAKCFGTRWINIWAPEKQKETVKAITTQYGVSERLQGLMCTEPVLPRPQAKERQSRSRDLDQSQAFSRDDLETAMRAKEDLESVEMASARSAANPGKLTFAQITDQIWHFSSTDYGPRYTCIGYNTLFATSDTSIPREEMNNGQDLPEGRRLWTWLVLCDDGTVISMQENLFPRQDAEFQHNQLKILRIARRNIKSIFEGVSRLHQSKTENDSLVTIRVRHFNDVGPDQANIKQDDGPSLLFYYLFDDWMSSFGLVAKREHKYSMLLEELRGSMLDKPVVDLVNELHWLGRRLGVLKRLYQSYELIMQRVLQRQRLLRDEARGTQQRPIPFGATFEEVEFAERRQESLMSSSSLPFTNDKPVGVLLSSAAVARFERLADRINLYCLSEIETCLGEKESLTFLDSQAVEKLTRITILLAKATIMFLPVSLMTAYFSTELKGVKGGIHAGAVLGGLCGDSICVGACVDSVWEGERYGGREDDLSVIG
ncbi:hypothetical protein N7481_009528 [Penicillium waksmanii]|uniref:uncharacterized protein n=1 Tax=Penicillium waksmanii TaxID=69791 RepID=UPI002547A700|nr:uncharacterized protein N7481_009528 [Penicillium waksmanii]KAJ5975821.1 hypothetical protein N7481_009528 [Penicillium waksmanii]